MIALATLEPIITDFEALTREEGITNVLRDEVEGVELDNPDFSGIIAVVFDSLSLVDAATAVDDAKLDDEGCVGCVPEGGVVPRVTLA